jgi:hypothetical protein
MPLSLYRKPGLAEAVQQCFGIEVEQVPWNIGMEPFRPEDPGLETTQIRDGNNQLSPGFKQSANVQQHGKDVEHVFQSVPHGNAVERCGARELVY